MKSPKVSVVMSEYNTNEVFFHEAVASVLNQTYKDFEFIIVDDSGINRVTDMMGDYHDKRIRIVKNDQNVGFVKSLNNGISQAVGEFIMRMDTDDVISADRFEKLMNFIDTHPEYSAVSSRAIEFTGSEKLGVIGSLGEKNKKDVMRGDTPVHAAAVIRKKDIEEIGFYKDFLRAEDLVLWCELLLAGKRLYMLNDVLYDYRVNPDDYKKRTIAHRKGEIKARLVYYPKLGASPLDYVRVLKSIVAGLAPIWMVRLYRNKFVVERDS